MTPPSALPRAAGYPSLRGMAHHTPDMKDIVALAKRRGFVFPASEIYGGINGFWDFGPLGTALKNRVRDAWWRDMVACPPIGPDGAPLSIVGLDSAIIQNPKVWEASGHVGGFNDPMVDCKESHSRYRADHLEVWRHEIEGKPWPAFYDAEPAQREKRLKKLGLPAQGTYTPTTYDLLAPAERARVIGPEATEPGTLMEPRKFSMMLHTFPGVIQDEENKAYLRPETAQGIFINFKNVLDSTRVRLPFGIAQVGKAFRNEVTPRNFIFRGREFEQMEMEWFCHPSEAPMWREFWLAERRRWWESLGIRPENLRMREHERDELSHYAKEGLGTQDVEYRFPFTAPDFGELEGVAHRCAFDLTQHQTHSGIKMEYRDPVTNEVYMPHVIEPAAGLTRGVLAVLCDAYTVDESRPAGVYLNFAPHMAPVTAAVLPLTAKPEHVEPATKLYMALRGRFAAELDIKQNIGKRYARQDEIGTPFCLTIDNEPGSVTVRHRNTMAQERVGMDQVGAFLAEKVG